MFLMKLLTASESVVDSLTSSSEAANPTFFQKWGMLIILGGFFLLLILGMMWSSRKRKKQQEEATEKLNALGAGSEVETIGGVFGTIVQMNKKEGTFILETGSAAFGKTYLCFDRNAIARVIEPVAAEEEQEEQEEQEDVAPEFDSASEENTENRD